MIKRLLPALLLAALGSPAFVYAPAASAAGLLTEQLGAAGAISSADILPIVQGSSPAKRTTVGAVGDFLAGRAATLTNKTIDCTSGTNTCVLPATSGGPTTPAATTPGFVPLWGDTAGGSLEVGLPAATSGVNTIVETDATGHLLSSILPLPAPGAPGGVDSFAPLASKWLTGIGTDGTVTAAQPGFADLTGQATFAQLPPFSAARFLGATAAGQPTQLPLPGTDCGASQWTTWHAATGFTCTTVPTGSGGGTPGGAAGSFQVNNGVGGFGGVAISGDVSVDPTTGLATVSKINGVAPAAVATTGSASDLNTGNLPIAQSPSIAGLSVMGNLSGSAAPAVSVSASQLTASLVHNFTPSLAGDVPASGGGTANFLRADGSWAVPPSGSGGGTLPPAVIDATTATGVDICQQISHAAQTLSAASPQGGTVDARGFTGTHTCTTQISAGWPQRGIDVLFGPVLIRTTVQQCTANYSNWFGYSRYPNALDGVGTVFQADSSFTDIQETVNGAVTTGSRSIVFNSVPASIQVGMAMTGTGIAPHTKVDTISGTTVGLTLATTATVNNAETVDFVPALVCLGSDHGADFHTEIFNIASNPVNQSGSMKPGAVAFQNISAQEGSYWQNVYAGMAQEAYDIEWIAGTPFGPENSGPYVGMYSKQPSTTTGLDLVNYQCAHIGNSDPALIELAATFQKFSCAGQSTTAALISIDGISNITISDSHFESAIDGILVGPNKNTHGVQLINDTCGTGMVTDCVKLVHSPDIVVQGVLDNISTNILEDTQTGGCTLTGTSTGSSFTAVMYFRGSGNGTNPVLKGFYSGC